MSHKYATRSKRMKLTPEDDINGEKIIDNIRSMASSKGDGRILNLLNLPNEVIEKNIFPYLRHKELIRIRLDKRLSDIANQVIEKRDRTCTKILIAGGCVNFIDPQPIETSYILEVYFDDTSVKKIEYRSLPNVPHALQEAAFGNFAGRTLIMGGQEDGNGLCCEFDEEKYQVIPSLNHTQWSSASAFIQNKVVITGGSYDALGKLDSIQILDLDEYNHGSEWIESPSTLPFGISQHTLVTYNNKLYLIGGIYNDWDILESSDSSDISLIWSENQRSVITSNKIWEGIFDSQKNEISWVEMGFSLQKKRCSHFSFVISNEIIVFGGEDLQKDRVEIIQGNKIRRGTKVPFQLNTVYDQAILDRKNRIIITSNNHGLIVYDHNQGTFTNYDNFKLREERGGYAAVLQ